MLLEVGSFSRTVDATISVDHDVSAGIDDDLEDTQSIPIDVEGVDLQGGLLQIGVAVSRSSSWAADAQQSQIIVIGGDVGSGTSD